MNRENWLIVVAGFVGLGIGLPFDHSFVGAIVGSLVGVSIVLFRQRR